MAVRKRGHRWQVDVYINKERVREAFRTKAEAYARQAELLAIKAGNKENSQAPKQYKKLTLSELLELTTARYWKDTKSEMVQYKTGTQIIKMLGPNTLVAYIDLNTIDSFITQCKLAENAPATINRKIAVLQKMLRYAYERGYITSMPRFERMKTRQGRIRYLSYEEEEKILSLANPDFADFISLAIETGGRCSEIFNLKREDVQESRLIFWETKNNKSRSVPLTEKAKAVLTRRLSHTSLWPSSWTKGTINQRWAKLRKQMDLEHDTDFVFHCTRHTCATRLLATGASLREVQHWLGHSNITQTAIYAHLEEDAYFNLASRLDARRQ